MKPENMLADRVFIRKLSRLALPLAALGTFVFHWPVWLVYACTCLDEVGKIPWVMLHFRKYRWVRDLTRKTRQQ